MYVCTVRLCKNTPRRPAVFTEDGRIKTSSKRPERRWKSKESLSTTPTYASLHSTDACGKRGHHFIDHGIGRESQRKSVSAWLPPRLGSITTPFDSHRTETTIYKPNYSICTNPSAKQWIGCVSINANHLRKFGLKFQLNHLPECAQLFVMC